jgi:hypothetical protein
MMSPIANIVLTEKDLNRLWSKVMKGPGENDCWGWTDVLSKDGYAYFSIGGRKGKKVLAHRLLYELIIGPIPDDKDLDHLCRNRWCVRPDHQEPVTRRVNLIRGETPIAREAMATHCPQGHPYDLFNTRFYRGNRICRICSNLYYPQKYRKSKKEIIL